MDVVCEQPRGRIIRGFHILLIALLLVLQIPLSAGVDETFTFQHITNENGLPSSYVKSITQDPEGFIWLATRISVTRLDGYEFREFPFYEDDSLVPHVYCDRLFVLADSLLLARSLQGRYYWFDSERERFKSYTLLNKVRISGNVYPDGRGFWILHDGAVSYVDATTGSQVSLREKYRTLRIQDNMEFQKILVDGNHLVILTRDNHICWINTANGDSRIFDYPATLNQMLMSLYCVDNRGCIWFSEENHGLYALDIADGHLNRFSKDLSGPNHISHNMIHCIVKDREERLWIGTEAGLAIYHPENNTFTLCQFDPKNPGGLNSDPIYNAFCDRDGNVWLGTFFGGVNLWVSEKNFFQTWTSGFGPWQLRGNVVSCFAEDCDSNLWIGLEDMGLNKLDMVTGEVKSFTSGMEGKGLTYNNLHDLLFVDDHTLWIATYTGGINVFDTETGEFRHMVTSNMPGLPSDIVYCLLRVEDSIFVGTALGIAVYDLNKGSFSPFRSEEMGGLMFESMVRNGDCIWFSNRYQVFCYDIQADSLFPYTRIPEMKDINFVKADSHGRVWIGDCYEGLCCVDELKQEVRKFNKDNGFPVSWIFSLEEGEDGWYWASSDKGLVHFSYDGGNSVLYDNNSGIPFNQFNFRASFIDGKGTKYFGGNNGMVSFNEKDQFPSTGNREVVFTGMQLFNKQVVPGKNSPISISLNKADQIILNYDQNVFTLEYSALCYASRGRYQYAYYLEGFEEDWNFVGNRNFAVYTNLSPGRYTFHVKGSPNLIRSLNQERTIDIIVSPPFWRSGWGFVIYFLLAILTSFFIYRIGKNLEKSRALVAMERKEKEHADEIHKVKLEFFTNISHELKAPLTLILGPIKKFLEEEKLSFHSRQRLIGIEKNAHRLFLLINQLLEFRKIESGKESLNVTHNDVCTIAEDIAQSFEDLVEAKDIDFVVATPQDGTMIWFDYSKTEKIIFNLLSNAFKFTGEGGRVEFRTGIEPREARVRNSKQDLVITVSDTGKGIKPELIQKVFDRFVQVDRNPGSPSGSGIGLAYVKSLVILHKGDIRVESKLGEGTRFIVRLPASREDYTDQEIFTGMPQFIVRKPIFQGEIDQVSTHDSIDPDAYTDKPLVLIVEDNAELVSFLREVLERNYRIITAIHGLEALKILEKEIPDIIVSDLMMPEMDGYEFVKRTKEDLRTSHIPVIMLTSKSGTENHLRGFESGADIYMEKPFIPELLEKNIQNILKTREKLIRRFNKDASLPISSVALSESDRHFMEKLTSLIKENISDTQLDVAFLVKHMGLSRSMLHMKLKGLIGCSTTEYIRAVRVKEAVKLISNGSCNISQAAYATGFSSPTYFTRRFKELYGKSPREYFNLRA